MKPVWIGLGSGMASGLRGKAPAVCISVLLLAGSALGQGMFSYSNVNAPTRLGSADGPVAGPQIFGQMLAGPEPSSLAAVGPTLPHRNGFVFQQLVPVPTVPPYQFASVQLVAWDSLLWGTDLAQVPPEQLGRTDVVRVFLTRGYFPDTAYAPRFGRGAVVPVPEPSTAVLLCLGGWLLLRRGKRRPNSP